MFTELSRDEIRQLLQKSGFVHITGLLYHDSALMDYSGRLVQDRVKPGRYECGCWDQNNGKTVVVTTEGEVWLSTASPDDVPDLETICPRGRGAFVPMSNTDVVDANCLLQRVHDPDWAGTNSEFSQRILTGASLQGLELRPTVNGTT